MKASDFYSPDQGPTHIPSRYNTLNIPESYARSISAKNSTWTWL